MRFLSLIETVDSRLKLRLKLKQRRNLRFHASIVLVRYVFRNEKVEVVEVLEPLESERL